MSDTLPAFLSGTEAAKTTFKASSLPRTNYHLTFSPSVLIGSFMWYEGLFVKKHTSEPSNLYAFLYSLECYRQF
jgi:hypothetical protein